VILGSAEAAIAGKFVEVAQNRKGPPAAVTRRAERDCHGAPNCRRVTILLTGEGVV
jgi:hypothetical protein